MNYTKNLPELLNEFPQDIQDQRVKSIWWFTLGERCADDSLLKRWIKDQWISIIQMIQFAWNNEELLTSIWMSSHFLIGKKYFEPKIQTLLEKIDNLFVHELSLPAHQTWYSSQSELVKDIKINLIQLIEIIEK